MTSNSSLLAPTVVHPLENLTGSVPYLIAEDPGRQAGPFFETLGHRARPAVGPAQRVPIRPLVVL